MKSAPEIPKVKLIYPYYNNKTMLEMQVENWSRLNGALRSATQIILVDDHSSKGHDPVPILEKCKAPVECYRIKSCIPFNMHEARNIGAKIAGRKKDNPWMFMSDIDIMITPELLYTLMTKELDTLCHYTFDRAFAPEFTFHKPHVNTFLVKHSIFWQVNGYDLDLTAHNGGGYGGDNQFMRQLAAISPHIFFDDIVLLGYGRRARDGKPVIPDADTSDMDRNQWHNAYIRALDRKKATGDMRSVNPIRSAYERTL